MGASLTVGMAGFLSCAMGMTIGGVFAWGLKRVVPYGMSFVFSLCTGMIFGLLFLDIIPESMEMSGWAITCVGMLLGGFLFHRFHKLTHNIIIITDNARKDMLLHTGIILVLSMALHNFPSGFAFGSNAHSAIANSFLIAMFLHNIPEGIVVFTPFLFAGFGVVTMIALSLLLALPVGIGAITGDLINIELSSVLGGIASFAAGMIGMVTVKEIMLPAFRNANTLYSMLLCIVGVILIYFYLNTV
jgi:ZIP family zinc transporter